MVWIYFHTFHWNNTTNKYFFPFLLVNLTKDLFYAFEKCLSYVIRWKYITKIFWKKLRREPRTPHNTSALSIHRHNFEHAPFIKFPFLPRFINDSFYTFLFSKSCQNSKIKTLPPCYSNTSTNFYSIYIPYILRGVKKKKATSDIYSRSKNLNYPLVISWYMMQNV